MLFLTLFSLSGCLVTSLHLRDTHIKPQSDSVISTFVNKMCLSPWDGEMCVRNEGDFWSAAAICREVLIRTASHEEAQQTQGNEHQQVQQDSTPSPASWKLDSPLFPGFCLKMTLKQRSPDQESHKHRARRSAFPPSPGYLHQLIPSTASSPA